jgi:4-amino-4-deoxy-L-arabinose transferase-like glycosyltransferase
LIKSEILARTCPAWYHAAIMPNKFNFISRVAGYISGNKYLISMLIFLLAFMPRFLDLDRFLTPDEFLWVDRAQDFLAGLTNPDYECAPTFIEWENFVQQGLACTLRTGHPGVTTMWSGSTGFVLRWLWDGAAVPLHDYVLAVSTDPLDPDFIAPTRLGTVLVISLWVVAMYWLMRRLFGAPIALITAILMALDPFHIALSRVIHHDAFSTVFMTLSALCAFVYWGEQAGRKWLVVSGLLAGFAFLSKSPAMYLMPFIAVLGFWFAFKSGQMKADWKKTLGQLILEGLLWFVMAAIIFVLFWPAMWIIPLRVLETIFFIGSKYAEGGHAKGVYFLGEISKDPGPLFYPITWLYRTSPLVVLGVVAAFVMGFIRWKSNRKSAMANENTSSSQSSYQTQLPSSNAGLGPNSSLGTRIDNFARYFPLVFIFILGYYLLVVNSAKKQERYFLPVYPWLNFLAAAGLLALVNARPIAQRLRHNISRLTLLVLTLLVVNGLLVVYNFPYYFTYYSPLFGGIKNTAKITTIGWGEGMDLAADYLNKNIDPSRHLISSWYQSTFAPYYHGPSLNYSKEKGEVLAGDYAIFYINQVQRRYPDDVLFDYFEERFEPIKTISLHGLDYVWIYPSLGIGHHVEDQVYDGIAALLAWQWANDSTIGHGDEVGLFPGQSTDFELYWEYLGKHPDELFFFRLLDAQDRIWAEGLSRPVETENPPVDRWRQGEILFERGTLTLPAGLPPGQYRLQIGFYTKAPAVKEGELLFTIPNDEALVTVGHTGNASYTLPPAAISVDQPLGDNLTLLGAAWPTKSLTPGDSIPLDLYWRVNQPTPAKFKVHVGLMDEAGDVQQAWFDLTLAETYNAADTTWAVGDIIHTRWQLDLLPETPPNTYYLELVRRDDIEKILSFGKILVGEE